MRTVEELPADAYIVLISGDRNWTNEDIIRNEIVVLPPYTVIIHGAARGVDMLTDKIARERGLAVIMVPAHWQCSTPKWIQVYGPCTPECTEKTGRAAGVLRNDFMLRTYNPDYLIAFHPFIGTSRGTGDCVKRAKKQRIPGKLIGKGGETVERW